MGNHRKFGKLPRSLLQAGCLSVIGVLGVMPAAALADARYSWTAIDTPTSSRFMDLNQSGQAIGDILDEGGHFSTAVLYADGILTPLGAAGQSSYGQGINDAGQVVGYSHGANGRDVAFIYDKGKVSYIKLSAQNSYAVDINNRGDVLGYTVSGETRRAFIYKDGVATYLDRDLPAYSAPLALNDSGQIVFHGGSGPDYIYDNGTYTYFPSNHDLYDINAAGTTVGRLAYSGVGFAHAAMFQDGTSIDLGTLGTRDSAAYAINARGQVVGWSHNDLFDGRAFLYENGKMVDLNNLVDISIPQFVLKEAVEIADSGKILAYGCVDLHYECRSVILSPVPEPATTTMLLTGLALLGIHRGRKARRNVSVE